MNMKKNISNNLNSFKYSFFKSLEKITEIIYIEDNNIVNTKMEEIKKYYKEN